MGHPNANAAPTPNFSNFSTPIIQPLYHNSNMPNSYVIEEARVQDALKSITTGIKPSIRRLVAEYYVLYDILRNRYNGIPLKDSYFYALLDYKEEAIH